LTAFSVLTKGTAARTKTDFPLLEAVYCTPAFSRETERWLLLSFQEREP